MAGERATGHGIGEITSEVSKGELALKTTLYVRDQLAAWRDDPDRPDEESEVKLNAQLCKFLDSRARSRFAMIRFDQEEHQVGRYKADLAASPAQPSTLEAATYPISIYDPVLIIECKRLPAPSADREREYVTGGERKNGGIQRFKLGLYAAEQDLAALVGYVQQGTPRSWHQQINRWISDLAAHAQADVCVWDEGENLAALDEDAAEGVASCRSTHGRIGDVSSPEIEIHHLWISMQPAPSPRPSRVK